MRSLRARLGSFAVVATIATLALAGCSSGGGAAGGATAEPLPDDQQKLVYIPSYGWAGSDISQSPLEIGISMAISQTLEALITLDKDSKPQPKLADSWAWTDPTTLVFKLHPGVKFSDGQAFTAADVKGSIERYIGWGAALKTVLAPITSVTATDDLTVTIKTSAPTGTLLGVLSLVRIGQGKFSHSDTKIAADNTYWAKPIGTGAVHHQRLRGQRPLHLHQERRLLGDEGQAEDPHDEAGHRRQRQDHRPGQRRGAGRGRRALRPDRAGQGDVERELHATGQPQLLLPVVRQQEPVPQGPAGPTGDVAGARPADDPAAAVRRHRLGHDRVLPGRCVRLRRSVGSDSRSTTRLLPRSCWPTPGTRTASPST